MALLEIKDITKSFGETQVLSGISFNMEKGEVIAVIGSSGSGKTTLLRCINFLEQPDGGTITVNGAEIYNAEKKYLYSDGDLYYFMDMETYEQLPIGADKLSDNFKFVKENMMCKIISYKGNVFGVEPPMFVELEVTDTEPGFKGDTATGASKPATLETGAQIKVPLFINIGDVLRIDTRTGEYLERA